MFRFAGLHFVVAISQLVVFGLFSTSRHYYSVFCSIFPSPDQQMTTSLKPAAHNTGGSLPDLTNIQFPPPLPTPLDSDDAASASFSSSSGAQTLANTQGNTVHRSHLATTCAVLRDVDTGSFFGLNIGNTFAFFCVYWIGGNTSEPTVTMEMQTGQDDMVPLILNAGDSHQHQNLQLSPTSPPLTLSQVQQTDPCRDLGSPERTDHVGLLMPFSSDNSRQFAFTSIFVLWL